MLEYIRLIWSKAFQGFALRIELWYAVAGIIVSGLTGSRERPVGSLTPFEIARYLLVAVAAYAFFRVLFLAPYRLWQEQRQAIAGFQTELMKPYRLGHEHLHKIWAEGRMELATSLQTLYWDMTTKPNFDALDGRFDRIVSLTGKVNPPPEFMWLMSEMVTRTGSGDPSKVADGQRINSLLVDFLHGRCPIEVLGLVAKEFGRE